MSTVSRRECTFPHPVPFPWCVAGGVVSTRLSMSSGGHERIITCTKHHGLECFVSASCFGIYKCNRCCNEIPAGITRLRCRECDFDVCVTCVASHMKLLTKVACLLPGVDCRGRHMLEVNNIGRCGNGCNRQLPHEDSMGFSCRQCNHDVCMRCVASCLKRLELNL